MSDNDITTDKPNIANRGRSVQPVVDLFPALADRRMMQMSAMRQAQPQKLGTQISVFQPVSFEEAMDIVECLRMRAATTISLENMKKMDASRLVDFVAGASAALDGDFHKLSEQVYLFCPSNIKITADKPVPVTSSIATTSSDLGAGALDFLYPSANLLDSSSTNSIWTQPKTTH